MTVVIPAYRRPDEVARAVASVRAQTVEAAEIVVVDDASGDGTAERAEGLGVRVLHLKQNLGAAGARNAGIDAATGDWVALLDSDDEWLPHHLASLWDARVGHVAVAGASLRVGEGALNGRRHGSLRSSGETLRSPADVLFPENPIPLSASMVRRDLLLELGGFDLDLRYSEDFDLWLRVLERGTIRLLGDVTVLYHLHPGQKGVIAPSTRQAQDQIVDAQRARPWWRNSFGQQRRAVTAWDDLRQARRTGDRRNLRVAAVALVGHPGRWLSLGRVWRYRWSLRRMSGRWDVSGAPRREDLVSLTVRERVQLVRRPPAEVVVHNYRQRLVARALRAKAVEPGSG